MLSWMRWCGALFRLRNFHAAQREDPGGLGHRWAPDIVFRFFGRPNDAEKPNRKPWYEFRCAASFFIWFLLFGRGLVLVQRAQSCQVGGAFEIFEVSWMIFCIFSFDLIGAVFEIVKRRAI